MQNVTGLRTVEWKNNKVIMIEQTKLPNELRSEERRVGKECAD